MGQGGGLEGVGGVRPAAQAVQEILFFFIPDSSGTAQPLGRVFFFFPSGKPSPSFLHILRSCARLWWLPVGQHPEPVGALAAPGGWDGLLWGCLSHKPGGAACLFPCPMRAKQVTRALPSPLSGSPSHSSPA